MSAWMMVLHSFIASAVALLASVLVCLVIDYETIPFGIMVGFSAEFTIVVMITMTLLRSPPAKKAIAFLGQFAIVNLALAIWYYYAPKHEGADQLIVFMGGICNAANISAYAYLAWAFPSPFLGRNATCTINWSSFGIFWAKP